MNSAEMIIMAHEGREPTIYRDTMGVLTCGIGHALHVGSRVPGIAIDAFFRQDMEDAVSIYCEMGLDLDPVRRAAVIDMCFNLGPQIKRWRFIERIKEGNWEAAGYELRNSKWWSQVGRRSKNIKDMILTGKWPKLNKIRR